MTENKQATQISEDDVALWLGREIMTKNVVIKGLEEVVASLRTKNEILEGQIKEMNKQLQFKKVEEKK